MISVIGFLTVLTPILAQTNGYVGLSIYIDNVSPYYDFFSGLSTINSIDEEFHAYAHWVDNVRLKEFVFEWDKDGMANDSAVAMVDDWSNVTKSFNGNDEGKTINYRFHGYDSRLNYNTTSLRQVVTVNKDPDYSDLAQSNNSPSIGDQVNISSYWTDNFEVDRVYLQTNESGAWHDNGSPVDIDNQEGWANFTIDTTGFNTSPYYWRLNGYDQVGNDNTTPINYFTPK